MPKVPSHTIKWRAEKLREKGRAALSGYLENQRDQIVDALIENDGKGRTPQFAEVEFAGPRLPAGKVVRAKVVDARATRLVGEVVA
jgi:threonylcarbamoyladenosine tRNA methylthiotransferase MtaB